jgi:hypothetical protein
MSSTRKNRKGTDVSHLERPSKIAKLSEDDVVEDSVQSSNEPFVTFVRHPLCKNLIPKYSLYHN